MEILIESKRVLAYAGLANTTFVRIGGKSIRRSFVRFFVLSVLGLGIVLQCCLCAQESVNSLIAIILPLDTAVYCLSMIFTHTFLISKTDEIAQLFGYFQRVINQSNQNYSFIE